MKTPPRFDRAFSLYPYLHFGEDGWTQGNLDTDPRKDLVELPEIGARGIHQIVRNLPKAMLTLIDRVRLKSIGKQRRQPSQIVAEITAESFVLSQNRRTVADLSTATPVGDKEPLSPEVGGQVAQPVVLAIVTSGVDHAPEVCKDRAILERLQCECQLIQIANRCVCSIEDRLEIVPSLIQESLPCTGSATRIPTAVSLVQRRLCTGQIHEERPASGAWSRRRGDDLLCINDEDAAGDIIRRPSSAYGGIASGDRTTAQRLLIRGRRLLSQFPDNPAGGACDRGQRMATPKGEALKSATDSPLSCFRIATNSQRKTYLAASRLRSPRLKRSSASTRCRSPDDARCHGLQPPGRPSPQVSA